MTDEYFDKPTPRRPLISEASVRTICGTTIGLGLIAFAHLHPDVAMKVLGGGAIVAAFIFLATVIR